MDKSEGVFAFIHKPKIDENHDEWEGTGHQPINIINIEFESEDWKKCIVQKEHSFKITETGLYRTRDGKRIFLYYKGGDVSFFDGVIEGETNDGVWGSDGKECDGNERYDIIGKWTEEDDK